jgi:Secretion system C-terminal sorting domain
MITTTKTYLVLSIMLLSITSFAQTIQWPQTGSDWHYQVWYFAPNVPTGFQQYYYAQDTVINNVNYKQVKGIEQLNTTNSITNIVTVEDTTNLIPFHFFTSNDTVYYLTNNGSLQFVWRNNAVVNEVWDFGIQYNFSFNVYQHAYCKVDSIKTAIVNGYASKDIYTHACKNMSGADYQAGDTSFYIPFAQNINTVTGPKTGFNLIGKFLTGIEELMPNQIACFESDSVSFYQYNSNINCVNNITTGIENNIAAIIEKLIIYPNPVHSELRIMNEGLKIETVKIYNVMGERVFNFSVKQLDNVTIDVSSLPSGVYFIRVQTDNNKLFNQKIIISK